MLKYISLLILLFYNIAFSQTSYNDSIKNYIDDYVATHEVVKEGDKKYMQFFPPDKAYRVVADVVMVKNAEWFPFNTSSGKIKNFRRYGKLTFIVNGTTQSLYVYQSQSLLVSPEYEEYLFLPFTDKTNGNETYEAGRYIDLKISDIKNNNVVVDFNKAYNPYCAYVSGVYSCPVPPKENRLPIAIKAGEKKYLKEH